MMQVTPVHRVLNLLAEQWFYHVKGDATSADFAT